MKVLVNKPASNKLLSHLKSEVIESNLKGIHTTIISFRGSGQYSQLKYLVQKYKQLEGYRASHLFTFLDLRLLLRNEDKAFRECISFLNTNYSKDLDVKTSEYIKEILLNEKLVVGSLYDLINHLTHNLNKQLTFVIANFRKAYDYGRKSEELSQLCVSLLRCNPANVSFTFIAQEELNEHSEERLGALYGHFIHNKVCGKDILFGKESIKHIIQNHEDQIGYKFGKEFSSFLENTTYGDPSVIKYYIKEVISNNEIEKRLVQTKEIAKVYSLSNTEYLDSRFENIVKSMGRQSINCLLNNYQNPTEFLLNTGLVRKKKGKYVALNPLFDHYVKTHKNELQIYGIPISKASANVKVGLSGQEMIVFELFESKEGVLVTKDEIAKKIWGDEWEKNYSDWAIDKLISNLRKKLRDNKYPKTLKSLKGKGLMLT